MHAQLSDVEVLLMRSLHDEDEINYVNRMLQVVVSALRAEFRSKRAIALEERMEDDEDFAQRVRYVEANAVSRMVSNPRGSSYEVIGPFSIQTPESGDGGLWFLESELQLLGLGGDAFSIRPHLAKPSYPDPGVPPWFWDWGSS